MADMEGGGGLDAGTLILPILERITDPKINRQQIDTQVELNRTLLQLIKTFEGFNSTYKGGGGSGRFPTNKNPLQPQAPSSLMNAFSWMGEKKDKAMEVIKKGFFKLFKTDYFTNLLKSIGALAKAIGNTFMDWLKFFIMMAFIDPSGGFMRDIINLFTQIGMIVFKTVMPLIPIAVKMMFDTIVYVFKLILKLMPSIIDTIMRTFTQLGDTFPILKPIIGFINQFLSAIRSLFLILNDPKADKGGGFRNFLSKVFKILGELLGKVIDYAVKQLPIIIEFVTDFIVNTLIPAFVKYAPIVLDEISKAIGNLTTKYPSLKVWIQPFKDILDMMSAFIGSFAKFNSTEYIQGLDEYKKKEKELFAQKQYQSANEQTQMKMLSDMQYGFMIDNKDMLKKANEDFNKLNEDKVKLAKDKWSEFISHVLDTLGATYTALPTEAKVGIWAYGLAKVAGWLISIGTWAVTNKVVLTAILTTLKTIGASIATFVAGLSAVTVGIVLAVLAVIGLIWYFWDDITKFFSDLWKYISDWWDTVEILEPLKNIGLAILGFLGDIADGIYDEFLKPIGDMFSDIFDFFANIKLPDWLTRALGGMGGGTDASELQSSRSASPQAKPYNPYADPMFQKQQKEMAIKYESDKNKAISKVTNSPININKDLRLHQQAMINSGYYNKLTEGATTSINQALKEPLKVKTQIDLSTEKIKLPAPKMEAPKYDWLTNFFLDLRTGFDRFMNWILTKLSKIPLIGYNLSSSDKLKSKVFDPNYQISTEQMGKFYKLTENLSEEETDKLVGIFNKTGGNIATSKELVAILQKLDSNINAENLAKGYKDVTIDKLFIGIIKKPNVTMSTPNVSAGKY